MKFTCIKCKKEIYTAYDWGKCQDCKKKENRMNILFFVGVLVLILGLRVAWAKLVYHDIRCVMAECRISK